MQDTRQLIVHQESEFPALTRKSLEILQVNLGYLCNLSCVHCHVNAGPHRVEQMEASTVDLVLQVLEKRNIKTLDLTGGAPEMNPSFRSLVNRATQMGVKVIDRCNLAILNEQGYEDLGEFLASNEVNIVASLPCYSQENVDKQRGQGAFENSIKALRKLNELGYGKSESLVLDLVYNPLGPVLPPPQKSLEADYKQMLGENFGITFNHLLTITNMPISRFGAILLSQGQYDEYMDLLKENYASENLDAVMCRNLISVNWQGFLFDCDFNQMLKIPTLISLDKKGKSRRSHLSDLLEEDLQGNPVQVADHCFGCTAGQGSSCSGAL